jgi:hypothetical protein
VLTLHLPIPWRVCTPTVYRFLDSQHVDEFFADGTLQLSSFDHFRKHPDEQRIDPMEGKLWFFSRNREGNGQTVGARARCGGSAYVLCGMTRHDRQSGSQFGNSYIRINHPTEFGCAVANAIPGVIDGMEGFCLYQERRVIERDLGVLDLSSSVVDGKPNRAWFDRVGRAATEAMGHLPYFLKEVSFAPQLEYRFVWLTNQAVTGTIKVRVPEARRFCSQPNALME